MHPLLRNVVIGIVGLIIAGGLTALALLGRDSNLSILAMVAAAILALLVGVFLYAQGWVWGSRTARRRETGQSVLIAVGGGLMALIAAVALAGLIIAGGLTALALLGRDSNLSILAMVAAAILALLVGVFLYAQGWVWGSRTARRRETGQSVLIAVGGGLMALIAAVALAGLLILLLLFFLG